MSRRFQLSLRTLLWLVAILCASLGAGHLLRACGPYVVATPAKWGEPIMIRGRIVRAFGPKQLEYVIVWHRANERHFHQTFPKSADRTWLGFYEVGAKTDTVEAVGEYDLGVVLGPFANKSCDEQVVSGKLTVMSPD